MIPPIPHSQTLHNRHSRQSHRSRFIVAPPIGDTRGSQQSRQDASDALVIDIVDASMSPLVVENT